MRKTEISYRVAIILAAILVLFLTMPVMAGNSVTISGIILPISSPNAAFSGSPLSGVAPLSVTFTDQSTNTPMSWKWEYQLGSGSWTQFSIAQSPSYTFTATGTYSIRLTVTNAAGSNTLSKTNYITVAHAIKPVARFSQNQYIGVAPLTVRFTDKSLNTPTSWNWQFGDGGTSIEKDPDHTFTRTGIFVVRERVNNAAGSDSAFSVVLIYNRWW